MTDKYAVTYKGSVVTYLNERLAKQQKVTDEQLAALRLSHQVRFVLFKEAKATKDRRKLKLLAKLFDELEFMQQEQWNFPQDPNFHRFFELPGCTCPKLDNEDALGTIYRITDLQCAAHGSSRVGSPNKPARLRRP